MPAASEPKQLTDRHKGPLTLGGGRPARTVSADRLGPPPNLADDRHAARVNWVEDHRTSHGSDVGRPFPGTHDSGRDVTLVAQSAGAELQW